MPSRPQSAARDGWDYNKLITRLSARGFLPVPRERIEATFPFLRRDRHYTTPRVTPRLFHPTMAVGSDPVETILLIALCLLAAPALAVIVVRWTFALARLIGRYRTPPN